MLMQGDELMRLTSETPDIREMMRGFSQMSDGPEAVVTADDYLNPRDLTDGVQNLISVCCFTTRF